MAADRFLTLADVAEELNISQSQTYALVRSRELTAIQIGGRGQWRVERAQLESYIQRLYDQSRMSLGTSPPADEELTTVDESARTGRPEASRSGDNAGPPDR